MRGVASLRELVRRDGAKKVGTRLTEAVRLPDDNKDRLRLEDVSVRELYEAFVGPTSTLPFAARRAGFIEQAVPIRESGVETSAFPSIMGELISQRVLAAYAEVPTIGDQLVTTVKSKNPDERIPGFTAMDGLKPVKENMPYEETGFAEKYVLPHAVKMGRILRISEETVFFDRTGRIIKQATRMGQLATRNREVAIINAVVEKNAGTDYYYWPNGTARQIYAETHAAWDKHANDNICATNALVDWTDINAAELLLAAMVDDKNQPIVPIANVLLVPPALLYMARHLTRATELEIATAAATFPASYKTKAQSQFKQYAVVSSPFVKVATQSDTTWYFGDPKSQFEWMEIWPIQVLREVAGSGEAFLRDTLAAFKVRYYGGAYAIDHRFVIQNTE